VKVNGGSTTPANGVDPETIARVYAFDWKQGGAAALRRLRHAGALVEDATFRDRHLRVGQRLRLTSQEGRHATVTIAGVYRDPQLLMGLIVSNHLVQSLSADPAGSQVILVKAAPGTSPTMLERGVKRSLAGFPDARVQSNAEYERQVEDQVDQLVYLLYGLLAMSVVISLFGIVNTLVLTIYERTREIGMLRAIGTTRPQMRRMIRYESVLTSVIGGLLGVVVGLVFGWIVTRGLQSEGISFAVPWWQLFVVLIVATAVGVVAAIWPAVRAARLDVLEALQYE
jgi:putative ABC transport system permease protein